MINNFFISKLIAYPNIQENSLQTKSNLNIPPAQTDTPYQSPSPLLNMKIKSKP